MGDGSKRTKTLEISLYPREIYYVNLESYDFFCYICKQSSKKTLHCIHCGKTRPYSFQQCGSRPVIIVHSPTISESKEGTKLVLAIPLTSTLEDALGSVIIPADEETGLSDPSRALIFKIATYDKDIFFKERKLGKVGDEDWDKIKEKLKGVMGLDNHLSIDGVIYSSSALERIIREHQLLIEKIASSDGCRKKCKGLEIKIRTMKSSYEVNIKAKQDQINHLNKENKLIKAENTNLRDRVDALLPKSDLPIAPL